MTSRLQLAAAAVVLFFVMPLAGLGLALVAALGGPLAGGCGGDGGPGGGRQQLGGRVWSSEQTANAQTVVARAVALGLPKRGAVIAVSTGIVESELRNLDHGDRDSLGIFQQRPSQGWGAPAQILNPRAAADTFYQRLKAVPNWQRLPPGVAADTVQHSAHPERYAPQEAAAAALVARFWPGPDLPSGTAATSGPPAAGPGDPVCPDDGASDLPLPSGALDRSALPPNFTLPSGAAQQKAVAFALAQVGRPYVFGAKGPAAFDCSGLMQAAWAAAGVGISAGTLTQIHDGVPVASLAELAPGDLLFIPGSLGTPERPRHVGIYIGHGLVVDAFDTKRGVIMERLADWQDKISAVRRVGGVSKAGGSPRGFPAPAAAAAR